MSTPSISPHKRTQNLLCFLLVTAAIGTCGCSSTRQSDFEDHSIVGELVAPELEDVARQRLSKANEGAPQEAARDKTGAKSTGP